MVYRHTIEVEILDPFDPPERMSPQTLLRALSAAVEAVEALEMEAEIGEMRVITYKDDEPVTPLGSNVTVINGGGLVEPTPGP